MESRTLSLLEFPRVLARLAALAASEPAAAACQALVPFADREALEQEQLRLAEARELRRDGVFTFAPFPDIAPVFDILASELRVLDLDALVALHAVLAQGHALREALAQKDAARPSGAPESLLRQAVTATPWPQKTQAALARCLAPDGRLRDESSPELFSVRQEIRSIHQTILNRVKEHISEKDLGPFLQDDYVTISSDRYVLPLKANFKGRIPGIIHDYSQTGETVYVEPFFLVEINNRLQELKNEEREAEAKVLAFLTGLARAESGAVAASFTLLVSCDVLWAKAALAEEFSGSLPEVSPDNPVHLLAARHPLLALAVAGEEGRQPRDVVAQDLILADDQKALIVTGANAGGKTVCLKTLGLLAVMALSGLPIPAAEGSRLPFFPQGVRVSRRRAEPARPSVHLYGSDPPFIPGLAGDRRRNPGAARRIRCRHRPVPGRGPGSGRGGRSARPGGVSGRGDPFSGPQGVWPVPARGARRLHAF